MFKFHILCGNTNYFNIFQHTKCISYTEPFIGPSGVRALPLGVAEKRSVLYVWYYFSSFLSSPPHNFLPEGVVLGLQNFAWSFKSHKNKIWGQKKLGHLVPQSR